jgi:hypothetical protein
MTTSRIGLRGGTAVAEVDSAGFVHRGGSERRAGLFRRGIRKLPEIGWWVAADDRWHDPRHEPSRRQRTFDGTPVVETKVAVPSGDVVQRAYMVADHGGCVVMEISNESPTAVVVAVPTSGLASDAATAPTEPRGLDLPSDVRAFPLAHRSTVRFAWRVDGASATALNETFASAVQVARGWSSASERASRMSLGAQTLVAARCALLLAPASETDDLLQQDAARGVLAIAERVRMGEQAAPHVEQLADAVRRVLRAPSTPWASRSLVQAARVLAAADQSLASSDVAAAWAGTFGAGSASDAARTSGGSNIRDIADAANIVASAEDSFVRAVTPHEAELFPYGLADAWRGMNFEAHGLVAGPQHTVSIAVRWHGPNAAVLWEVEGPAGLQLRAPRVDETFVANSLRGEGLMRVGV